MPGCGPLVGWIGEHAGPRWGLVVGGVAALVAAGLGAWTLLGRDAARAPMQTAASHGGSGDGAGRA